MARHKQLLITGNSSGLGLGLTRHYLGQGWQVRGCSRRGCPESATELFDQCCDLTDFAALGPALERLLGDSDGLDLVILNAGVLGRIGALSDTPLAEVQQVMQINVWANKVIMDWLHAWGRPIGQLVMISSGAAVLGNKGWGAYALSKATLNMLARLYAHEFPSTHISALAPGLIDSAMMDYLCAEPDPAQYPALQRLRAARGSAAMPAPDVAAQRMAGVVPRLREYPSGSFVDSRQILDPEAYQRLMAGPGGSARG